MIASIHTSRQEVIVRPLTPPKHPSAPPPHPPSSAACYTPEKKRHSCAGSLPPLPCRKEYAETKAGRVAGLGMPGRVMHHTHRSPPWRKQSGNQTDQSRPPSGRPLQSANRQSRTMWRPETSVSPRPATVFPILHYCKTTHPYGPPGAVPLSRFPTVSIGRLCNLWRDASLPSPSPHSSFLDPKECFDNPRLVLQVSWLCPYTSRRITCISPTIHSNPGIFRVKG